MHQPQKKWGTLLGLGLLLLCLAGCGTPTPISYNTPAAYAFARIGPIVTPAPTEELTATPTVEPSLTPTHIPTATSTATPTVTPTAKPIATPTAKPTARPINAPAANPLPPTPAGCQPIASESYGLLNVAGRPANRPAAEHADINMGLRGWTETTAALELLDINGVSDAGAPQLSHLFNPRRVPDFKAAYQIYNWDFSLGRRTQPIAKPDVTLLGIAATPGESVFLPDTRYEIGDGYHALVLYAAPTHITLKYTREDDVAGGYTLHLDNVCIDIRLLALYQAADGAGRKQLPALRNRQPFGRANGMQILVGIQDVGTWMDPRSRKDWWQER